MIKKMEQELRVIEEDVNEKFTFIINTLIKIKTKESHPDKSKIIDDLLDTTNRAKDQAKTDIEESKKTIKILIENLDQNRSITTPYLTREANALILSLENKEKALPKNQNTNLNEEEKSYISYKVRETIYEEKEKFSDEINSQKNILKKTIHNSEIKNHEISEIYNKQLKTIETLIEKTEEKHRSINELLESASGRVVASDYQNSATEEKNVADKLRYASLAFMSVAAVILIYTVFESSGAGFNLETSISRLLSAILLSVPAAYLARESAKHREQQYQHHQTSLDLITITPYIATLPDDMQHEIKIDIAKRIFASRKTNSTGSENYPLNLQEVMIELIKKMEPTKDNPQKVRTPTEAPNQRQ